MQGGTLFKYNPDNLLNLEHKGDEMGCAACVFNVLNFPSRTIQQCIMRAAYEEGIADKEMLEYVKQLEDSVKTQILHKIPLEDSRKSEFVYYGITKTKDKLVVGEKNYTDELTKIDKLKSSPNIEAYKKNIKTSLLSIFKVINNGYANILNILWSYPTEEKNLCRFGHWVVIGKTSDNKLYLIDSQESNLKGIHYGLRQILLYIYLLTNGQTDTIIQSIDYLGTIIGGKMIDTKEQRQYERKQTQSIYRSRSPSIERSASKDAGKITNKYRKKVKQFVTQYRKKNKKDKKPRTKQNKKR